MRHRKKKNLSELYVLETVKREKKKHQSLGRILSGSCVVNVAMKTGGTCVFLNINTLPFTDKCNSNGDFCPPGFNISIVLVTTTPSFLWQSKAALGSMQTEEGEAALFSFLARRAWNGQEDKSLIGKNCSPLLSSPCLTPVFTWVSAPATLAVLLYCNMMVSKKWGPTLTPC